MNTQIHEKIRALFDQILFFEKKSIFEHNEVKLYPSEIHLILAIHRAGSQAKNITRIAENLGVTKGAISQTISRLRNKKVLETKTDPAKKNELVISFTDSGSVILDQLLLWREESNQKSELLSVFNNEEKEVIQRFLERLEQMMINENR